MADRHQIANGNVRANATWSLVQDGVAISDSSWPGSAADGVMINDGTGVNGTLVVDGIPANALAELRMFESPGVFNFDGQLDIDNLLTVGDANLEGNITGDSNLVVTGDIASLIPASEWGGFTGTIIVANGSPKTIETPDETGTIANLVVQNAAAIKALDDLRIVGSLTIASSGELDMDGLDLSVAGDIDISNGLLSNTASVTLTADGDIKSKFGNAVDELVIDSGVTATIVVSESFRAKTVSGEGDIDGAGTLVIESGDAGFWAITGTVSPSITIIIDTTNGPGADIVLTGDKALQIQSSGPVRLLTLDANINIAAGALTIQGTSTADMMTLDFVTFNLTCGAVVQGSPGATTGSADISLGTGTHIVASWVDGNAVNDSNATDFGRCTITLTGVFDGDNITFTNTSGVVVGGTINNVDLTGETALLHIFPAAGGTNNTNVTEIAGLPGGKVTASVGVAA